MVEEIISPLLRLEAIMTDTLHNLLQCILMLGSHSCSKSLMEFQSIPATTRADVLNSKLLIRIEKSIAQLSAEYPKALSLLTSSQLLQ